MHDGCTEEVVLVRTLRGGGIPKALQVAEQGDHADQAVKSHRGGHGFRLQFLVSLMSTTSGNTAARVLRSRPGPHDAEHALQLSTFVHRLHVQDTDVANAAPDPLVFIASKDINFVWL